MGAIAPKSVPVLIRVRHHRQQRPESPATQPASSAVLRYTAGSVDIRCCGRDTPHAAPLAARSAPRHTPRVAPLAARSPSGVSATTAPHAHASTYGKTRMAVCPLFVCIFCILSAHPQSRQVIRNICAASPSINVSVRARHPRRSFGTRRRTVAPGLPRRSPGNSPPPVLHSCAASG